jgi:TP901 family phage tail tape measure protein
MPARASDISVRLRLRGQRQFKREVSESTATLEAMGVRGAKALGAFARQSQRLKDFGRNWTRNVSLPLAVGGGLAVKAAIDWESAFAGVEKTVNATPAQFKALEGGLRSMSTHIPVAANDLAEIAEAAGQLGIKRRAIMGFTRTVADLGVATNLAGDEGASTLAKFANITQMPQSKFDRLGSTIVALGNAGASTEKDIAAMGLRLAAAGAYVGMSEPQILGFANALSSVGIEAEAGGTAMSQVFKSLNSAVAAGGPALEDFASVAGVSGSQFAASWKKDAATATVSWIEGLARLKKEGKDVPALLSELSPKLRGARIQDTLLRASGAGKLLSQSLGLGVKSWHENNALSKEASKRYQTVASKLRILKNQVIDLGVTIGQELLPPLIDFVGFADPKIASVAKWFGGLDKSTKRVGIGVAAFAIALGPLASAMGFFAGGVGRTIIGLAKFMRFMAGFRALAAGVGVINALKIAMAGFGLTLRGVMMTTGIGLAITAVVLLNEKFHFLGPTVEWVTNILGKAFTWIKGAVSSVIGFVKSNWKLILIALTGPVGIAVALLIKYWGTIKGAVSNAVQAVLGFVRSHWKTMVAILAGPIGLATKFILDHWGQIKGAAQSAVQFVIAKWNGLVSFIASVPGKMKAVGSGIFNFVKEGFRSAINWVIDRWNALHFSVPSVDLGPLGSIGGQTINFPNLPHLAHGGNIARRGAVVVGERGPEMLQLPTAARVTPLDPKPLGNLGRSGKIRQPLQFLLPNGRVLAEWVAEIAEDDAATA